jgi:hypothetical protein
MEIYKDIQGYEGYYQVSNLGNVRSLDRKVNHPKGGLSLRKGFLLKPEMTFFCYFRVPLSKNKTKKRVSIHRLVAETFIPNINNKSEVNHIDGNKTNNKIENLEWVTSRENIHHYHLSNGVKNVGISYAKRMNKFQVSIYINKKKVYLGSFKTEQEALNKYNEYKQLNNLKNDY